MALFIGMVSQKGGVGKSTLARLLAREYANAGWNVKIADLDVSQGTSFSWQARRLQNALSQTKDGLNRLLLGLENRGRSRR
jgi:chromosome partitioning protein